MKKRLFGVFLAAAACVILLSAIRTEQLLHDMSQKVLRFHVLANSDEERDQDLKLKVRDAVGSFMAEQLKNADTIEQSRQIVNSNLEEICAQAQNVVEQEGYDYPVSAALVRTDFPEKTYGQYTFPAGNYEALRVVIGEGEGHNWWCVMYPNLCFSGSMYSVDEASGETLRQVLMEEEYRAVMEEGNYKVRFKILGFLNKVLE